MLELEIVWEDEHMIEVSARTSNGAYSGSTKFYTSREELIEIAEAISGYPRHSKEIADFAIGQGEGFSNLFCKFIPTYPASHFKACVTLAHVEKINERENRNSVNLEFPVEPAGIDSFTSALKKMGDLPVNSVISTLKGEA